MSFTVAAEAYDRFMGRYSRLLAPLFADFAGVDDGVRILDVGCGPGALTSELVARVGPASVVAVDPSPPFVEAMRARLPEVEVHQAAAEALPFATDSFDMALAQLVVHHMADPVRGVAEMARVTRPGEVVAACVWDHAGGRGPLGPFWSAARRFDPTVMDESDFPGVAEGQLVEIFREAGVDRVEGGALTFEVEHSGFDEWWEPFPLGVGPAGAYVAALSPEDQAALASLAREELPAGPFTLSLTAWAARGTAGPR